METLRDLDVVRAVSVPLAVRVDTGGDPPDDGRIGTLYGHSTIFDAWYEVDSFFEGQFLERVVPGAARKTIAENGQNVKVLFNHGRDAQVGNKVLGVHEDLREDDQGVYYQVPLLDTTYNRDLLPGLHAGAYGSSFMFRVIQEAWDDEPGVSDHNPKGIPERTITEFRLFEHGPVTFPANPAATSGARACSLTDDYYASLRDANPDRYDALTARVRASRTSQPVSGPEGGPTASEAAPATPTGVDPTVRARVLALLK